MRSLTDRNLLHSLKHGILPSLDLMVALAHFCTRTPSSTPPSSSLPPSEKTSMLLHSPQAPLPQPCKVRNHTGHTGALQADDSLLKGQISTSLTSLSRTIDDYADLAKKELIQAKQEKAYERVKTFRGELGEYRERFAELRQQREDTVRMSDPSRQSRQCP